MSWKENRSQLLSRKLARFNEVGRYALAHKQATGDSSHYVVRGKRWWIQGGIRWGVRDRGLHC